MHRTIFRSLAVVPLLLFVGCASTGDSGTDESGAWAPQEDVRFVVPTDPGGGQDIMARSMAAGFQSANKDLNIAVENRPGGSSAVGSAYVAQKTGSPNILLTGTISTLTLPMTSDVPYTWKSFTPIAMVGEDVSLAVVRNDSDFETLPDIADAAKSGMVRVGIAGKGSPDDLTLKLLTTASGSKYRSVVFQSGADVATSLLAGDVEMAIVNPGEVAGQLEAGKFRAVAVFGAERYPSDGDLGDIPTATEQGIKVELGQMRAVFAPDDITKEQRSFWEDAVESYTKSDEFKQYANAGSLRVQYLAGKEFEQYLADQESTLKPLLGGK